MSWKSFFVKLVAGTFKTLLAGVAATQLEKANEKIDQVDNLDDPTKAVLKETLAELVAEILHEVDNAV